MESPNVRPPTPQRTPKKMVIHRLNDGVLANSPKSDSPLGTASNAPRNGNTSQAKRPCTIQYDSHDQSLILLMGT